MKEGSDEVLRASIVTAVWIVFLGWLVLRVVRLVVEPDRNQPWHQEEQDTEHEQDDEPGMTKPQAPVGKHDEWQLAPKEPTEKMLVQAFHDYMGYERQGPQKPPWNGRSMWRTMLAAAPSPPPETIRTIEMLREHQKGFAAGREFERAALTTRPAPSAEVAGERLLVGTKGPYGDERILEIKVANGFIEVRNLKQAHNENLVVRRPVYGYEQHLWDAFATPSAEPKVAAEIERLRAALTDARDALRNDFEPDNQSMAYKRASAALEYPS